MKFIIYFYALLVSAVFGMRGNPLKAITKFFLGNGQKMLTVEEKEMERAFSLIAVENELPSFSKLIDEDVQIQRLLDDNSKSVALYDRVAQLNMKDQSSIMQHLKERVFNRFPARFDNAGEIAAFGSRPEYMEYLLKSNAFNQFVKDKNGLGELLVLIKAQKAEGINQWESVLTNLEWAYKVYTDSKIGQNLEFVNYIADHENAMKLLIVVHDSPNVMKTNLMAIEKSAFKLYVDQLVDVKATAANIMYLRSHGLLDRFSQVSGYKTYITDPFRAYRLLKTIQANKKAVLNENEKFMKGLAHASKRGYNNQNDVLSSIENEGLDISEIVKFEQFIEFLNNNRANLIKLATLVKNKYPSGISAKRLGKDPKLDPVVKIFLDQIRLEY